MNERAGVAGADPAVVTHDGAVRLLCFGGPLNEQMIDVRLPGPILVPLPDREAYSVVEPSDPTAPAFRTGRYDVEKVGYHDESLCEAPFHDYCRWEARCLVFEGYPKHRITDTLNAIVGMSNLWTWLR